MGVGTYYFYHGFGLKAFEGRHIRIPQKIDFVLYHTFIHTNILTIQRFKKETELS